MWMTAATEPISEGWLRPLDIDGTLLRGRDGPRRLGAAYRLSDLDDVPHAGFTDRATALALARANGLDVNESRSRLDAFFAIKDRVLAEQVAADPLGTRLEPTTGAHELLATLRAKGILLGLVTGNTPLAAASKLLRAGIDPAFFAVGGYGDACVTREELVAAALVQARALLPGLLPDQVAIVGDTAADVASARAVGSRAVAVLGGRGDANTLSSADVILADLASTLAFTAILGTN